MGSIHLVLPNDSARSAELLAMSQSKHLSAEFKEGMLDYAWQNHATTIFHEWAHVLQVASYPLLFVRARRSARYSSGPFAYLGSSTERRPLPLLFRMNDSWYWGQQLEALPVRVTLEGKGISLSLSEGGRGRRGVFCELDLIEEDATIFQYRAEIGSPGNGEAYSAWLNERVRYRRVFDFCAKLMGRRCSFKFMPLAIPLAFTTTRPLEAFFKLLGTVVATGPEFVLDVDDLGVIEEIFRGHLLDHFGEVNERSLSPMIPSSEDEPGVITDTQFANVIAESPQLAVQPMASIQIPPMAGPIGSLLRSPWLHLPNGTRSGTPDLSSPSLVKLLPPAISVRLRDDRYRFGSTVLWVSPELIGHPVPEIGIDYAQFVIQGLRYRHLSKALTQKLPGSNIECPHSACPMNDTGLCRDWFPIPESWAECAFPEYFGSLTNRVLEIDESGMKFLTTLTTGASRE